MINYGRIKGSTRPQELEITNTSVMVASDIAPYEEEINDHIVTGYEYNYTVYSKDEYLLLNTITINNLQEELAATKILLGVE